MPTSKSISKNGFQPSNLFLGFIIILFIFVLIIIIILSQLKEYYDSLDPMLMTIQRNLMPLHPIVKDVQFYEGNKSYTINKKKIYLCLKDSNKEYYDYNMLIYVSIHELAHVLCDEIGHTPKFDQIFHELLQKGIQLKLYDPNKPIIKDYCGHH